MHVSDDREERTCRTFSSVNYVPGMRWISIRLFGNPGYAFYSANNLFLQRVYMLPISKLKRNKMTKGAYDSSELAKRVVLSANVIPNWESCSRPNFSSLKTKVSLAANNFHFGSTDTLHLIVGRPGRPVHSFSKWQLNDLTSANLKAKMWSRHSH